MKVNYLDLIPERNPAFSWDENEEQLVTIYRENKGLFHRAAQRFWGRPKVSQIHLDQMGSLVWGRIDGSKTAAGLAEEAGTTYEQAAVYLKMLEQQGFIVMKKKIEG